jgi:HEAT repeat protein
MPNVTVLARLLQDKQVAVRAQAAEQLSRCGEEARNAAVDLVQACGDDESVREWAVAALEELGPPPKDVVEKLRSLVAHTNELVAYWAVTLLGRSGSDAAAVAPAFVSVLEMSPHLAVRQRAAWALGQIGNCSPATVAALERATSGPDPRLARLAAQAIEQLPKTV